MLVTLFGIAIAVKPEQPENAQLPMLVTPSSMVTRVISVPHGWKMSSMAPLPEMVSSVPSSVQVMSPGVSSGMPMVMSPGSALALKRPTGIINARTVSVSRTLIRDRKALRFVMRCSSL